MKRKWLWSAASVALAAVVGYGLSAQRRPTRAEYAWLSFGPTGQVRVLVALAGDTITLEQFAGETPTGRKEQFRNRGQPLEVALADPDGVTSYVIRKCAGCRTPAAKKGSPTGLLVDVDVNGPLTYHQYSDAPAMARHPESAPVSHFHGPLAVGPVAANGEVPPELALCRGDAGTDLQAFIGTLDAGRGCWVVVKSREGTDGCLFPDGARPFADVEFPPKKPGDPPVKRRYALDHFC